MKQANWTAWALFAFVGAGALAPQQAFAQEDEHGPKDGFELQLGVAAFYKPEYKGSADYEVQPLPWVSMRYSQGDRYIALMGPSLRANLVSGGGFEFGPVLNFESGRPDDIENRAVRRLGEIDDALIAGVFVAKNVDLGEGHGLQLGAEVVADTGSANEGTMAKFELGYQQPLGQRTMLIYGASTTWADENYMQTYYGVTPRGALASGLPVYNAKSGIDNVEVSATLMYQVNDRWSVLGRGSYERLLDSASDSPIIQRGGSENQGTFAFAVIRSF